MDTPAASPELLLEHQSYVRALARELVADEHQAEDVAQETWVRYLRRPPRERGATRAWLRQVAARLSIEGLRVRARRAAREERAARPEALPSVAEEASQAEAQRRVVDAVLALDEPYRTSVLLAYWRGWDARRIAAETGAPLATVRSRLQRAHAKLRERLDRTHGRASWALAAGPFAPPAASAGAPGASLGGAAALATGAKLALGGAVLAGISFLAWQGLRARGPEPGAPSMRPMVAARESDPAPEHSLSATALDERRSAVAGEAAPAPLRVAGRVANRAFAPLGLEAQPAPGVTLAVALVAEEYGGTPVARREVATGADGRFEVALADPGTRPLWLQLDAPADEHYRPIRRRLEVAELPGELALERAAHGTLEGIVIGDAEEPLAGARLRFPQPQAEPREATSDADGRFEVRGLRDYQGVEVDLPGYTLLQGERPTPLEEGGWEPLRVRLSRQGLVRLAVVDADERGIAGAEVSVALDPSEQAVLGTRRGWGGAPSRRAATDASGVALVEGVWARRKLQIGLHVDGDRFTTSGARGSELALAASDAPPRPLVVPAGGVLELTAWLDVERDVAGRVVDAGGEGVPGATVTVVDLGRGESWSRPTVLRLECGAGGRFAGRVRTAELVGPLRVSVQGIGPLLEPQGLGYVGSAPERDAPGVEVEIGADERERLAALELVLEPRFSIAGVLLDRERRPIEHLGSMGHRLWAVPAGTSYHAGGVAGRRSDEPGGFEVAGLAPGAWDLVVSEELAGWHSSDNFLFRFPGIEAGKQNVELVLPAREEVRIRVRVHGAEPARGVLLQRRFFPADPASFRAPRAEPVTRVRGAQGWPDGATLGFTGGGGAATPLGRAHDGYDAFESPELALQPVGPGWYAIGVHARSADGEDWYPQATPVLRFEAGEHTIDFELLPAAVLRGRVLGDAAGEFLAVALVDEAGRAVPVATSAGFGEPALVVDTSASGAFVLHEVPTGRLRLRAGSRAELERGEFRRELRLEITPGANEPVEIRL